jgi:hypothetical protein
MQILGMDVKDLVGKFADHTLVIDQLEDEMRRIEIQSEMIIGDNLPNLAQEALIRT